MYHLTFSAEDERRLDALRMKTESTTAEVIANALRLYEELIAETDKGSEILIREKTGVVRIRQLWR